MRKKRLSDLRPDSITGQNRQYCSYNYKKEGVHWMSIFFPGEEKPAPNLSR